MAKLNNQKKKKFFDGYTLLLFGIVALVIIALPISHPFTGSVEATTVVTTAIPDPLQEGPPPPPPEGCLLDEEGNSVPGAPFLLVQDDVDALKEAQLRLTALSEEITEVSAEIVELQDRLKKHTVRLEQIYEEE